MNDKVVVMGVSAGGFKALSAIFSNLSSKITWPILVVQHMGEDSGDFLAKHLDGLSPLCVFQAEDKMKVVPGCAYVAPGGYHMLLDDGMIIALSVDPRVCYSRPSIDVLFESAAEVCRDNVLAIVLTGANSDGAEGVRVIKKFGGKVIVQNPEEAEASAMPLTAIATNCVDKVCDLQAIAGFINQECLG